METYIYLRNEFYGKFNVRASTYGLYGIYLKTKHSKCARAANKCDIMLGLLIHIIYFHNLILF